MIIPVIVLVVGLFVIWFLYAKNTTETKEDSVTKIKQLKEMLDLGAISQEEFDIKKQDILNRM